MEITVGMKGVVNTQVDREDTAAEIVRFINVELSGKYTLDDVARRFGSPSSVTSSGLDGTPSYLPILRRLIDLGTVPPPQE